MAMLGNHVPMPATTINDGSDIILGDNGALEWLSTGRLADITGISIAANNPALFAKYGTSVADTDPTTLDLITTEQPTSGGRDLIYSDQGSDVLLGGTEADAMYGDDGDSVGSATNNDLMFGDHGRLYPQFSALAGFNSRLQRLLDQHRLDG
jgi:Ca2+-binding RTX toxin-like protein